MNIVVLDGYALNPGDLSWNDLSVLGNCRIFDRTVKSELQSRIAGVEAIITNKVVIDEALMATCLNLKYIGITATGYNTVDVNAANQRGIVVTYIPAYSTDSVAQLVFAHILNVTNQVELHARSVRSGEWELNADFSYWKTPQVELNAKTLGIVGFGKIGQKIAQLAKAFGMRVIFHNRSIKTEIPLGFEQKSLHDVFSESDFVSINCPLTAETAEFVNASLIQLMKPTAVLINTGRGGLINEPDLSEALNSGKIAAACLDVLSNEPPSSDNPLLRAKNCFVTPHIGWATNEARQRLMDIAVDNLRSFMAGQPKNVVK